MAELTDEQKRQIIAGANAPEPNAGVNLSDITQGGSAPGLPNYAAVAAANPQQQDSGPAIPAQSAAFPPMNPKDINQSINSFNKPAAAPEEAPAEQNSQATESPATPAVDPNAPATPVNPALLTNVSTSQQGSQGPSFGLGTQAASQTTTSGLDLSKSQGKLDAAVAAQKKAIDASVDVQRTQADYQATALQEKADLFQQKTAEAKARNDDYQAKLSASQNEVQNQYDLLKSATVKPNQLYENLSTGSKIQAGLAIGLGALGAAFTGGPNQALGIIQSAIDRDIDTQKANAAIREKSFGASQTAYSTLAKNLGDKELAATMLEKRAYEQVGQQLDAQLATTKDPEALAKGQALKAEVMAKAADAQERIDTQTSARTASTTQQGIMPTDASGKPVYLPPPEMAARLVTYPDGKKIVASSPERAQQGIDNLVATENTSDVINQMIALRNKNGIQALPTEDKATMELYQARLKTMLKESLGFKALTDTDDKLISNLMGENANGFGQIIARLQALKTGILDDHKNFMKARGLPAWNPNQIAGGMNLSGNIQPGPGGFIPNTPSNRATLASIHR